MNSLLINIFKGMNFWSILLAFRRTLGDDAFKRFVTPPESFVRATCKASGADFGQALEERFEVVNEMIEFIDSMIDPNFVDPDDLTDAERL